MYIDVPYLLLTLSRCENIKTVESPNLKILKEAAEEIREETIDTIKRLSKSKHGNYPEEYFTYSKTFFRPN